jgi:hypothetical protein
MNAVLSRWQDRPCRYPVATVTEAGNVPSTRFDSCRKWAWPAGLGQRTGHTTMSTTRDHKVGPDRTVKSELPLALELLAPATS